MDSLFDPSPSTLSELKAKWSGCTKCFFSVGTPCMPSGSSKAQVLILGQWPGQEDMKSGIPFSGPQGNVCKNFLGKAGFKESELFYSNVLMCTSPIPPSKEILTNCADHIEELISIVKPMLIVTLGSIAKKRLLGPENKDVFIYKGRTVVACSHPAMLARLHDPSEKKNFEQQMLSELQAAYALFTQQRTRTTNGNSNSTTKHDL